MRQRKQRTKTPQKFLLAILYYSSEVSKPKTQNETVLLLKSCLSLLLSDYFYHFMPVFPL